MHGIAWYKIFLFQTEDFNHLWFLNFDKNFKRQFHLWFGEWWEYYGALCYLLPPELQNLVTKYSEVVPHSKYEQNFTPTLLFMSKYKIPWIMKWHYELHDINVVSRIFLVKWWDKFKIERVIEQFTREFLVIPQTLVTTQSPVVVQSSSTEATLVHQRFTTSSIQAQIAQRK